MTLGKAFTMWRGTMLCVLCVAAGHLALAEETPGQVLEEALEEALEEELEEELERVPADAVPDQEMYGPTTRDDTLWSIARQVRAPGATLAETVSALQRMNPQAFVEGNPNLLMRGVMLKVPTTTRAAATATDAEQPQPAEFEPTASGLQPAATSTDMDQPAPVTPLTPVDEASAPGWEELARDEDIPPLPMTVEEERDLLALQNADLRIRLETVETELELITAKAEALDGQVTALRRRIAESETQAVAAQSSEDAAATRRNTITGITLALLVVAAVVFMYARRRRAGQPVVAQPVRQPLGARRIAAGRLARDAAPDAYDPSTKLNLARAFIDMGRMDQAREVLEEVRAEGSDDDRREAEELLGKME